MSYAESTEVLLSMCTNDGILFEYFGDESEEPWTVSIDEFVSSWKCGEIYGLVK